MACENFDDLVERELDLILKAKEQAFVYVWKNAWMSHFESNVDELTRNAGNRARGIMDEYMMKKRNG